MAHLRQMEEKYEKETGVPLCGARKKYMKRKLQDEEMDFLFQGILSLESIEECYDFFEDLCTVSELQEMSRRLLAAKLLKQNCLYADIAAQTGLSTATISRVSRCLKYGSDGYVTVLDRLLKQESDRESGADAD